jgi:alpha-beta hydrolase superfamily lysophospholipase
MVPPEGSRRFCSQVHQTDRELREYPGAYHGLFADLGHEEVLKDVERWLDSRIPAERL